jgi:hypothetical protein
VIRLQRPVKKRPATEASRESSRNGRLGSIREREVLMAIESAVLVSGGIPRSNLLISYSASRSRRRIPFFGRRPFGVAEAPARANVLDGTASPRQAPSTRQGRPGVLVNAFSPKVFGGKRPSEATNASDKQTMIALRAVWTMLASGCDIFGRIRIGRI